MRRLYFSDRRALQRVSFIAAQAGLRGDGWPDVWDAAVAAQTLILGPRTPWHRQRVKRAVAAADAAYYTRSDLPTFAPQPYPGGWS